MKTKIKKRKITLFSVTVGTILVLYSACILLLLVWAFFASMKDAITFPKDAIKPSFPFDFSNYKMMLESFSMVKRGMIYDIWTQFWNSILYAAGGAFFQTLCTAIVAYCTAKYKNWFSTFFNSLVIVTISLPIVGNMPSMVRVLDFLDCYNELRGMWIMKFGFINVYYFIFYATFKGISWDYAEAAFLDGASHFGVFIKIMAPMAMSLFGTIFLLFFITYWNDYQTPLIYWEDHPTIAYGLWNFMHAATEPEGVVYPVPIASNIPAKIAGGVFVALPLLVVFIIFRNKLMSNLSEGGIKA